ncbi:MAG TPA: M14 family zinc carboxypeptidase, partial [Phycisphaerae bacterium]|nr:M14 family zinc carboxypeptidase [Phycisphaerae bacterium]
MMRSCPWLAVLVALAAAAPAARGQVALEWDFDHGALDLANTTITPTEITLGPRTDIHSSRWIYCKASNVLGLNPEFRISDAYFAGSTLTSAHRYVYSYDQQHWVFFDNGANTGGYYRFSNVGPFTQDDVWLAYSFPYPWAATEAHMDHVAPSPWVTPTPSADANFVLGLSNDGTLTDKGRAVPQLNMYGYLISDPSAPGPKTVVVLTTGNHPNETTGSYTFNGMVDFLLSDDVRAEALRAVADFYVYPNCNPDGRWAGHARSNPENPNV